MARPTARVLALLEILQSGGTWTVADLAARLAVDERTVRRYVEHLHDLDVPVRTVRGRHGGYRLAPGYRMPPLMLTDDEAVAVLLGLVATQHSGGVALPEAALSSAAAKVRRILPEPLRGRLDALLASAQLTGAARTAGAPVPGTPVLLVLAEAARDRRPVGLTYERADGRPSERTLHPYGLVAHGGRWYVAGGDSASGETRTFRLDRITSVSVHPGSFAVPDGVDPAESVLTGLAATPWRHEVSVRVAGDAEHVRARLPAGIATVTPLDDGEVRVALRVEHLDWVPAMLAGLGCPFVVERPEELRDRVRALAALLTDAAGAMEPRRS